MSPWGHRGTYSFRENGKSLFHLKWSGGGEADVGEEKEVTEILQEAIHKIAFYN